jgi:DNA-binding GntR family transcriptional regulator
MSLASLEPVSQQTRSDEVAERLRGAIRNGTLLPGARLIEADLAKSLAVSRIPVREAIQRLAEEGLVRKVPHYGTFVYSPTVEEIEQISSLRGVLERFVIERVVERWQDDHESQLRAIVRRMRSAAALGDLRQVYELDYEFHRILWEIAEHDLLLEVTASLRARISRFLYETNELLTGSELDAHIDSHDTFVDVLNTRDAEAARTEVMRHIQGGKARILSYLAQARS